MLNGRGNTASLTMFNVAEAFMLNGRGNTASLTMFNVAEAFMLNGRGNTASLTMFNVAEARAEAIKPSSCTPVNRIRGSVNYLIHFNFIAFEYIPTAAKHGINGRSGPIVPNSAQ
jgi:hypothetical protein